MKHGKILLTTILCALGCFALVLTVQAVTPAPDGGYAGNNTAEGTSALFNLSSGIDNTALGFQALFHDTTGNSNSAEGFRALFANTNGHQNTATGVGALLSNTTGNFNTATGVQALFSNTSGGFNTATGVAALFHNTAESNSAFGAYALFANTSGIYNSAFGYRALAANTGSGNTANGYQALSSNTSGVDNTATGVSALSVNNTGSNNTANGAAALALDSGGTDNTAIGAETLINNTSGNYNTAVGFEALAGNDTGGANTAVGYQALLRTTGVNNRAIGNGAGATVRTGSYNVYLGAGVGGVATDEVGHTYISNISSTVQPPGGNIEYVTINLDTKLLGHSSSSRRYKEDIKPITNASEALYRLKPVTYRYKKEIDPKQSAAFGLIAEEVAEVNPALIARNSKGQPESVHYDQVNAMLLNEFLKEHKAFLEEQRKVEEQGALIATQQKQIDALNAGLQKVSDQLELN